MNVMRERCSAVGGEFQVRLEPGEGTEILISLPLKESGPIQTSPEDIPAACGNDPYSDYGQTPRILLVDDHALFMDGLKNLPTLRGFHVVSTAANGWEALEKARTYRPEILLMDILMPECDGLMATRLIKSEIPDVRIVILTMSDREKDLYEAIRSGASGYILKGNGADALVEKLRSILRGESDLPADMASGIPEELGANRISD